jgi:hypothetical protein
MRRGFGGGEDSARIRRGLGGFGVDSEEARIRRGFGGLEGFGEDLKDSARIRRGFGKDLEDVAMIR